MTSKLDSPTVGRQAELPERGTVDPAARQPAALVGDGAGPFALQQAIVTPRSVSPKGIVALQRAAGNRAVSHHIQARLTVGAAGDRYEREADRVAAQVLSMPGPAFHGAQMRPVQRAAEEEEEVQTKPLAASITPLVRRQAEEEEEVQAKSLIQRQAEEEEEVQAKSLIQRQAEEEEEVQTKPLAQRQNEEEEEPLQPKRPATDLSGSFDAGRHVESRLAANRGGGSPLPTQVRAFMEPRFGADFGGVRLHTGSESTELNRQLGARAFTHGQDIYLRAGESDLESPSGRQLLAHELTHTVQQGAVQPMRDAGGKKVAADAPAVQRYKTSVGWFSNKVKFESSGVTARLAEALRVKKDASNLTIGSQDYTVDATVKASGARARVGQYEVGFLQTLYRSSISHYYSPDAKPGLGTRLLPFLFSKRLCRTEKCSPVPVRDGDAGVKPWYEQDDVSRFDAAAESTKATDIYDRPTSPKPWKVNANGVDQYLVKTSGLDSFRTWLAVRNTVSGHVHRLNYIDWRVNYGTKVKVDKANPAASTVTPDADAGGKITGQGAGPGFFRPCLGDPVANDVLESSDSVW